MKRELFKVSESDRNRTLYNGREVVVTGVLYRSGGKRGDILQIYHKKQDLWTLPQGKVDVGETSNIAIIREMYEEIGIICSPKYLYSYNVIAKENYRMDVYDISTYKGNIVNKEPAKHIDMKWGSVKEFCTTYSTASVVDAHRTFLNL